MVVALTDQFDGKPISVNIDSYDVQVSGARERMVSGQGRVGVEGSGASITFNYRTVYDVLSSNAGYPDITISRFGAREHSVPNDAALIGECLMRQDDPTALLQQLVAAGSALAPK